MSLDRNAIDMTPRTTSGCLDMAVMFVGRSLGAVLGLWLLVTVPSCALVYALSDRYELGLWMPGLVVFFATAPLGVMLGVGACERAFGRPMSARSVAVRTIRDYWKQLLLVTALRIPILLGTILGIFPGIILAVRRGFTVEQAVLRRFRERSDEQNDRQMISTEFVDLLVGATAIFLFCLILWPVLFVTLDTLLGLLFGYPILLGRLSSAMDSYYAGDYLVQLLWYDPKVQTALTAVALLVYPVGRLAWFFCYIDLQVRCDCWDIQVEFDDEASRMQQALAARLQGAA
jgi:hypothetical protein